MHQAKLEQFFQLPLRPLRCGPSFLDLPYHIRRRIYLYAGLVRRCPIYLSREPMEDRLRDSYEDLDGINDSTESRSNLPWGININNYYSFSCPEAWSLDHLCDCRPSDYLRELYHPIPFGLFYSSRAIYEEVSTIFYGQNRFRVAFTGPGSFKVLQKLRPGSLLKLRFLRVVLHAVMKDKVDCTCFRRDEGRVAPLSKFPPRRYKNLMSELKMACELIASGVRDSQLEMCLICDTDDVDIVAAMFNPLKKLPLLRGFSIRLSQPCYSRQEPATRKDSAACYEMAKGISGYVTGRSGGKSQTTFRFDLLPRELWRQVLEHTDLVAPFQVAWSPGRGYSGLDSYLGRSPKGCQVCDSLCMSCCHPPSRFGGVWAADCSCWRYPSGIFAVNHAFNTEAKRIFWSMNKFVIMQPGSDWRVHDSRAKGVDELTISDVAPPGALRYLRFIRFCGFSRSGRGFRHWRKAIEGLGQLADLSKLTITVDICGEWEPVVGEGEIREEEYLKEYEQLIEPLYSLRELKAFFLHAPWPVYGRNRYATRLEWSKRAENKVMGEGYNSNEDYKLEILGRIPGNYPSDYDE